MLLFLIYEILAFSSYRLFYLRTKDPLNPIGIMSFSLIGIFGFTNLELYPDQPHLSLMTHLVVLMAFFEIVIVGFLFLRPRDSFEFPMPTVTKRFSKLFRISVVIISIITLIAVVVSFGEAADIQDSSLDKKGAVIPGDSNQFLNYGIQFIPYIALFAVFELLFKRDIRKQDVRFDWCVIGGCVLFSLFVLYSRGTLLVLALGSIFLISRRWKISLKHFIIAFLALILFLSIFMLFRVDTGSVVYAGITGNPILNMLYNYTAINYVNLDSLIQQTDHQYTWIMYEFAPIAKLFGVYNNEIILNYGIGALNAHTFLYGFYHDLGLIGVFLYPTLISFFVSSVYNLAESELPGLNLVLAVLQKAIFAVCFGDYFIAGAGLSTWLPYLFSFAVAIYAFPEKCNLNDALQKTKIIVKTNIKHFRHRVV